MGDNSLTLQKDFYEWLKADSMRAGSKIELSEIEEMDAQEAQSKYASKFKEFLQSIGANEETLVASDINLEDEENDIFNDKFDDYISSLSKEDAAFKILDKNNDGRISQTEKLNFFESIDSTRKNEFNENDFEKLLTGLDNDEASKLNPFSEVQETQTIQDTSDISEADFEKINLEVTTSSEINEQLKLIDEQLSFYNANSEAVDTYLSACESVFNDAKSKFNEELQKLNITDDAINANLKTIEQTDKDIAKHEDFLNVLSVALNNANSLLKQDGLSEESKKEIQNDIKELIAQIEKAEETLDELYEKQSNNYEALNSSISANFELNSALQEVASVLSASYFEYSDMKSCQNRIIGQKPALEASKDILNDKKY